MCTSLDEYAQYPHRYTGGKESSLDCVQVKEITVRRGGGADADYYLSLGERIQTGKTIVSLTNLMTQDEIEYLKQMSLECADSKTDKSNCSDNNNKNSQYHNRVNGELDNEGVKNRLVIRMPILSSGTRHNCRQDALPESISLLLERIIERTLQHVDEQLCPSIKRTLFGDKKDANQNDVSIAELFRNNQLEYSTREPAINVYKAPHGHFGVHRDDKALTILIPLSNPNNDFSGGGTAFWSQPFPQPGRHDPSVVLRPEAGAVVLFGGQVQHAGLHIRSGTRVVFVASFSRLSK
eukprot:scaffold162_cov176-Amphora_coffeaeformis.AAC.1